MVIEPAVVTNAAEILALQKLAYQSEAKIHDDYTAADPDPERDPGHRSEGSFFLYDKLGYHALRRERITDKVVLAFMEKADSRREDLRRTA